MYLGSLELYQEHMCMYVVIIQLTCMQIHTHMLCFQCICVSICLYFFPEYLYICILEHSVYLTVPDCL
jgi:hypothetical protein